MDDKINEYLVLCVLCAVIFGVVTVFVAPFRWPTLIGVSLALFSTIAIAGLRCFRLVKERANYNLGYQGERFVGEILNRLMLEGCYVFHDFPTEKMGNIDHIVVAPTGVFVVETKTLRKQNAPPGKRDNTIIFDGQRLEFPHETHEWGLQQAIDNARWLSAWLSSATGEKVFVRPILTFPGWWVESRANTDDIKVVNPKQIRSVIFSHPESLSEAQRQRIIHQLEQKCRDVEF